MITKKEQIYLFHTCNITILLNLQNIVLQYAQSLLHITNKKESFSEEEDTVKWRNVEEEKGAKKGTLLEKRNIKISKYYLWEWNNRDRREEIIPAYNFYILSLKHLRMKTSN